MVVIRLYMLVSLWTKTTTPLPGFDTNQIEDKFFVVKAKDIIDPDIYYSGAFRPFSGLLEKCGALFYLTISLA